MKTEQSTAEKLPPGDTRLLLKRVARRLIAECGVRNVTVRQIAEEAGQKNRGAVAYYFGTKDALLKEVLLEGAERIEQRRLKHLEKVEALGGPATILDAVRLIVLPSVRFSEQDETYGAYFNRFLKQLDGGQPGFIDKVLGDGGNLGYQLCLQYLRDFLTHLNRSEQNRRFVFLGAYLGTLLAQRETMIADDTQAHLTWRSDETLDDIIRTAAAILQAPS